MAATGPDGSPQRKRGFVAELKKQGLLLGLLVGSMWVVELLDQFVFVEPLDYWGIHPRELHGLSGIPLAPFLHGGFGHLSANTLPLLVLGFFVMVRRKRDLIYVSAISALVGGLGTWLAGGTNTLHIGASILVFGFLGYLLFGGIFARRLWPILGSLVVLFLYGGALWGVLPGQPGVSWEGHAFGFLGGVIAAGLITPRPRRPPAAPEVTPPEG